MANSDEMFGGVSEGRYVTLERIVEIIRRTLCDQDDVESEEQRLLELVDENELKKFDLLIHFSLFLLFFMLRFFCMNNNYKF